MNEDRLKKLEEKTSGLTPGQGTVLPVDSVKDLITAYRQMEKDNAHLSYEVKQKQELMTQYHNESMALSEANAELLAALKEIEFQAKGVTLSSDSKYQSEVAQCIENNARQAHNKHKVE